MHKVEYIKKDGMYYINKPYYLLLKINKKDYIKIAQEFGGHLDMVGRLYWTSKKELDIFISFMKKKRS